MKQSFYPGDLVKIIHDGSTYSTYESFFDRPGLQEFKDAFVTSSREGLIGMWQNNGDEGFVVAVGPHTVNSDEILYVVQCAEKGYTTLISEDGLELVLSALCDIEDVDISEIL